MPTDTEAHQKCLKLEARIKDCEKLESRVKELEQELNRTKRSLAQLSTRLDRVVAQVQR